jgi:dTDP-glucose 4,6-dehydratase
MSRILITGGAGFQGVNLSRILLRRGHEVIILNTYSSRAVENLHLWGLEGARTVWGSITDRNLLDKTVRDVDMVVHAAANIHVDESIAEPSKYYEVNVLGTNNVLDLCTKRKIPMLYISSCEVYGDHAGVPLKEGSSFRPNSPYASSKAGADVMCYSYHKTFGTKVVIARPSNVFGPGQKAGLRGAVIPIFVGKALRDEQLQVFGTGDQRREFVYVDDLVQAYLSIIERMLIPHAASILVGRSFNLGSGNTISISELAQLIIERTDGRPLIHAPARPGEVEGFVLDSDTAYQMLLWRPRVTIQQGVEKYIEWVKSLG